MFGVTSSFGLLSMVGYDGCNLIFVIPFLVIGIGIDDMFIIYATYLSCYRRKLKEKTSKATKEAEMITELISKTLAKSGVSISITSLTDFVAFLVGLTTNFKSVQIFCVYCAFAIAFCYLYQITFFSGFLCLHIKRILNKRNSFLFCFK
jgi:predicted RND superfamily exporter protein